MGSLFYTSTRRTYAVSDDQVIAHFLSSRSFGFLLLFTYRPYYTCFVRVIRINHCDDIDYYKSHMLMFHFTIYKPAAQVATIGTNIFCNSTLSQLKHYKLSLPLIGCYKNDICKGLCKIRPSLFQVQILVQLINMRTWLDTQFSNDQTNLLIPILLLRLIAKFIICTQISQGICTARAFDL